MPPIPKELLPLILTWAGGRTPRESATILKNIFKNRKKLAGMKRDYRKLDKATDARYRRAGADPRDLSTIRTGEEMDLLESPNSPIGAMDNETPEVRRLVQAMKPFAHPDVAFHAGPHPVDQTQLTLSQLMEEFITNNFPKHVIGDIDKWPSGQVLNPIRVLKQLLHSKGGA